MPKLELNRWFAGLLLALGCDGGATSALEAPPEQPEPQAQPSAQSGCDVAARPANAPGGYYVSGNTFCTADGAPHVFHGVNRPGLEYSRVGDHLSLRDFKLMASWGANVVRLGLNQDFWLADSPQFDADYAPLVDTVVGWVEAAGMDAILDLHWSDQGVLGSCKSTDCKQMMADDNSVKFWSEVAARYRGDGRVLFELYNEPHDITWAVWKSGGAVGSVFQAVGMQQLYDTVRGAGADNLVLIGGLDWAYDLSGVPEYRIAGYNIAYATHPYNTSNRQPPTWDHAWGALTATDPVVISEFGNLNDPSCDNSYAAALIQAADARHTSWTAWGWYPGGCTYPALIDDWTAKPSALGELIQSSLLSYGGPHPAVEPEADEPLSFQFDHDRELWSLGDYQDPDYVNLGATTTTTAAGVAPPKLVFNGDDGDPSPGSLELHVTISAKDQYVIAQAAVVENLLGKTLHARVRLKSGSLSGATPSLHTCAGANFSCYQGPRLDPALLVAGQWLSLEWNPSSVTDDASFDTTQVTFVGVAVDATLSTDASLPEKSAGAPARAEAVLEIDSFTE